LSVDLQKYVCLNSDAGRRDIFAEIIVDFFFRKIILCGDDGYRNLILFLYSWLSSSFVHAFLSFVMPIFSLLFKPYWFVFEL